MAKSWRNCNLVGYFSFIEWSSLVRNVSFKKYPNVCYVLRYIIVDLTVLRKKDPLTAGFRALPFIYFGCIAFNVFAVTYQGSKSK